MRITLTKDFRKIATSYGLFQNLSGDANVEITENVQNEGIILRPFQIVTVNRTVWARKNSGAGTGVLAVLPFVDSDETSDDTDDTDGDTSEGNPPLPPPPPPPHHHPPLPPPPPPPPHHHPPPHHPSPPYDCFEPFPPKPEPRPSHHDEADSYVIKIPRALVERGQTKFVVDFSR